MPEKTYAVRTLTYRELLMVLHKKCKEKHTGIMVFKDHEGHLAKLALTRGAIIDVIFKGKRGIAALHLIKEIKQGRPTFYIKPDQSIERKLALSTGEIFKLLVTGEHVISPPENEAPQPTKTALTTASSMIEEIVSTHNQSDSGEGSMVVIEAQLSVIIGPIAKIVFLNYSKEIIHVASDFKKLNTLIEQISKELLNSEQQKIFRQNILAFINHYSLKGHEAVVQGLKGSDKKLRLNNVTLGLFVAKFATQGVLSSLLMSKLLSQIEQAGNLGRAVNLLPLLKFLEKSGKTGLLEVREKGKAGGFYFDQGVLINAVECGMNGKIIAMDILQWNHDYLSFKAVPQKRVSRQIKQTVDALAEEIELLKIEDESQLQPPLEEDSHNVQHERLLMEQAITFAESCKGAQAEQILIAVLMENDTHFEAWLWLSRVVSSMTAIEISLKKAGHIHPKNADLACEIKKFTLARKKITSDFVMRCPFCWTPIAEKDNECHYCLSDFVIEANFFKTIGKAKFEILDKAIERYSYILKQAKETEQLVFLRFYLVMAYLNRRYLQEGLDQFEAINHLYLENKMLLAQKTVLTNYIAAKTQVGGQKEQTISEPIREQNHHLKVKILIVEDSAVTRKVIVRTLAANGYEIFEAKNSFEALRNIEEQNPDIILLDIILPGKDGYEILEEIRQKPLFEKTPVIMLTSRDSLLDKFKGKVSSANEYLTKPFQPDELLKVVSKYFSEAQVRILADYNRAEGIDNSATMTENINTSTQSKVLVVEDSLVTRKVISRTLTARGYQVFEAGNSIEALTNIEQKQPDLILLDIILPGKNGYEILEEIKEKPIFKNTPIIMLTSRDGLFDKLKGKVSDANEYLTKPFQPDELLSVVRKYLR